eukprot:CAMPEP_0167774398 /NCGR_PEP_ID=MMETSP0111_2-20121227/1976_1 /TAXON_ID=91324 /ORGANISM="Lotharella globosa, Strain CCCM811" /LENGTH=45 /DNA_ID= /DNA_START= /DNA_END= /DNA_ORIENTATION=
MALHVHDAAAALSRSALALHRVDEMKAEAETRERHTICAADRSEF